MTVRGECYYCCCGTVVVVGGGAVDVAVDAS